VQVAAGELSQVGVYSMVLKYSRPEYPNIAPKYEFFEVHILDDAPVEGNSPPYWLKIPPLVIFVDPYLKMYKAVFVAEDYDLDELQGFFTTESPYLGSCLDCITYA